MSVPRNVLWFEVLLYLALTLDSVSAAFRDRTPKAGMTAQTIDVYVRGEHYIKFWSFVGPTKLCRL